MVLPAHRWPKVWQSSEIYELGAMADCRAHVVHCSIGRGYDLCEAYKKLGHRVSIEACVHYLALNENDVMKQGALAKVNPPIRPQEEVEKLWCHAAEGHIDFVSSDHVSWGLERKQNEIFSKNASGIPGLETLLPVLLTGCVRRELPLTLVARLLSEGPARHFCLDHRKGAIKEGLDADFAIVKPGDTTFDGKRNRGCGGLEPVPWSHFCGSCSGNSGSRSDSLG